MLTIDWLMSELDSIETAANRGDTAQVSSRCKQLKATVRDVKARLVADGTIKH